MQIIVPAVEEPERLSILSMLQAQQIHSVIGGIALPNEASVALNEKFGFRKVAEFHEVGFKFGRWIDVGYWQRIFDPQAPVTS